VFPAQWLLQAYVVIKSEWFLRTPPKHERMEMEKERKNINSDNYEDKITSKGISTKF